MSSVFPPTVSFLTTCQSSHLTNQIIPGLSQVSAFLSILSALLSQHVLHETVQRQAVKSSGEIVLSNSLLSKFVSKK